MKVKILMVVLILASATSAISSSLLEERRPSAIITGKKLLSSAMTKVYGKGVDQYLKKSLDLLSKEVLGATEGYERSIREAGEELERLKNSLDSNSRNNSNLTMYEYDREQVSLSLKKSF